MKIFSIGFNKTGTTSIHNLLMRHGINSVHTKRHVLEIIGRYEAFTDGSHYDFRKYYEQYPDALFILNTRPIRKWLISRYKHAKIHGFKECWCWPINSARTNKWIEDRESHFKNIIDFFKDKPKQLFIVNIEKPNWEKELLSFIKKPTAKSSTKSKANVRVDADVPVDILKMINNNVSKCLQKNGYAGNEVLTKYIDKTTLKAYKFRKHI